MPEIRVPLERLREVASRLEGQQQEVDNLLQHAVSLVANLYSDWSGLAQVDYAQLFNEQVPSIRTRFNEVLELLVTELRRIADVFEQTDEQVVSGRSGAAIDGAVGGATDGSSSGSKTPGPATPAEPAPPIRPTPTPQPVDIDFKNLQPQEFVDYMGQWSQQSDRETGVPASVTIAQAILETGWGKHTIGEANNLFGIKGKGPAGSVIVPTKEFINGEWVTVNAEFAKYHNFDESIAAHAQLISNSSYYTEAMKYQNDPKMFAQKLEGVYATDPQYAEKLISIMDQYDLYQYDV